MKQSFEALILAYLDGGLSEHEREELLHVLSVSPEKRALLDEHLQLRSALRAGERPFSAPLSVQRSLAARIPVLAEEYLELTPEPELFAQRVYERPSALRRGLRYITAFASQWSLQAGLAFGGSLVLVSGVTWKIASDVTKDNIAHQQTSRRAITRQAAPKDITTEPQLQYVPQTQMPDASQVQSGPVAGLIESTDNSNVAKDNSITTVTPRNTERSSSRGLKSALPVKQNDAVDNAPQVHNQAIASNSVKTNVHESSVKHASNVDASNASNAVAASVPSAKPEHVATDAASSVANPSSVVDEQRIQNIAAVPYRDVTASAQSVSLANAGMRIHSIEMDEPTSMNIAAHVEFSNAASSLLETGTNGLESRKSIMKQSVVGGIDFAVSPYVSFGIEAGVGAFSQAANKANEIQIVPGYSYLRSRSVGTTVSIVSAPWTRALVRYTFNPVDQVKFEVNGGAGTAFINGPAFNTAVGIRTSYDVAPGMAGIAQIGYGATWVHQARDNASLMDPSSNAAITGIVNHEQSNRTLVSGALDIRVGIGLSL